MGAVFDQLNRGEAVTSGLRKVDKSEMTHKNPSLRAGSAVTERPSSTDSINRSRSPAPQTKPKPESIRGKGIPGPAPKKEGKKVLDGNKWIIVRWSPFPEYFGHRMLTSDRKTSITLQHRLRLRWPSLSPSSSLAARTQPFASLAKPTPSAWITALALTSLLTLSFHPSMSSSRPTLLFKSSEAFPLSCWTKSMALPYTSARTACTLKSSPASALASTSTCRQSQRTMITRRFRFPNSSGRTSRMVN